LATNHCGATDADDLHWKVSADGTLTIFGTGKMKNFGFSSQQPWNQNKTGVAITKVVLEPGITHIGEAAFSYTEGLTKIVLPEGVTTTGDFVFEGSDNLEEVHLPSTLTSVGRCFFATITGTQPPAADTPQDVLHRTDHCRRQQSAFYYYRFDQTLLFLPCRRFFRIFCIFNTHQPDTASH
jgi:hypothetical protein